MAKMRKEVIVVLMTALLGMGIVVYFNACAAADELLKDTGIPKDAGGGGEDAGECTPDCSGKECGADNCGKADGCGTCPEGETCNAAGTCDPVVADPCEGKKCGETGTDGTTACTACDNAAEVCVDGACVAGDPCADKACGEDDGSGNKCQGDCDAEGEACIGGPEWHCEACTPDCTDAACGDDDGCSGECVGTCANADETCNPTTFVCEGPADPCAAAVNCGDIGTDGKGCQGNGICTDASASCVNAANGYECKICTDTCGLASKCGDANGCGGQCYGDCDDAANPWCDPADFTCKPDPCAGKNCGDTNADGQSCPGPCTTAGQDCRVNAAQTAFECAGCNENGGAIGDGCADRAACKCGNECAILFTDQTTGQCLEDCMGTGGECTQTTDVCLGVGNDGSGNATGGACFPTGKMTGTITGAKVLNSCQDQAAQTDIGSGTVTVTLPGKTASVNMFFACHSVDTTTNPPSDIISVQGMKACGTQACPDIVIFGVETASVKVGTVSAKDGVFGYLLGVTFAGQTVSDEWLRAVSLSDGSINITAAGTGNKQPFSAKDINLTMVKYDWEICGGNTGTPCQ